MLRHGLTFSLALSVLTLTVHARAADDVKKADVKQAEVKTAEAKVAAAKASSAKQPKKVTFASLSIKGAYPERSGSLGLFGGPSSSLYDAIRRLKTAGRDDKIAGIVLRMRGATLGFGKVHELRSAVLSARKAGKKVYALVDSAGGAQYQLACACDEIIMPPSGTLMIPGLSADVMFYKGLFDKVGIEADFVQIGKYKGAAEPQTRTGMSKEFRSQYEAVLDDYFDQMVNTIADDRTIHPKKVRKLIDRGLFSAIDAKRAGLIDRIAYGDQLPALLRKEMKADQIAIAEDYGKKKVDTDFSGFAGMMKMMELMMGGSPKSRASKNKKIAVIYAVGVITKGASATSMFGGETVGSDTIVKALRQANKDKTVVAIVLRVDSPGGSALASDLIWREIERIEKPVIASMGDTAASGGYYISMGCDKIFAEPGTLTGSIGVVGGKLAMQGAYDKLGLKVETIQRGKNARIFSSNGKFTDDERKIWRRMMMETYRQFTAKAVKGRKMEAGKIEKLAQGRIWTGRMAAKNGLVDATGTFVDALNEAKKMAKLAKDEKVELLILPKATSVFEQLFGVSAQAPRVQAIGRELRGVAPELTSRLGELELMRRLFAEPSVLVLPYRVKIR